jgi:hypothetical protein
MSRLSKFLRLSSVEKTVLVRVWILLGIIRLALSLLSFTTLRKVLKVISPMIARSGGALSEDLLVWAVGIVSRYVPKATCLTQALTVQLFLKQSGRQACLHIGVTGSDNGRLKAHAWVESQGRVIIGGSDFAKFSSLTSFE